MSRRFSLLRLGLSLGLAIFGTLPYQAGAAPKSPVPASAPFSDAAGEVPLGSDKTVPPLLGNQDPRDIVRHLDALLRDDLEGKDPGDRHARMGRALEALELPHLALRQYLEALKAGPKTPWFHNSFQSAAQLSRQVQRQEGLRTRLLTLEVKALPSDERAYSALLKGEGLLHAQELTLAIAHFSQLQPTDEGYVRARLLMANSFVQLRHRSLSIATLEDLRTTHRPLLEDDPDLLEVVILNLARAYYGAGRMDDAIPLYEGISRRSPHWLKAQEELAWTHYRKFVVHEDMDALNQALGVLHTLSAPFFAEAYLPEPALLEIQLLYHLCRFVEGSRRLQRALPRYGQLRDRLNEALKEEARDPDALTEIFLAHLRWRVGKGPAPSSQIPLVFRDQLAGLRALQTLAFLETGLRKERVRLESLKEAWKEGPYTRLDVQLKAIDGEARQQVGRRLQAELFSVRDTLNLLLNQAQLAQLDMVTAEKALYEAAAAGRLPHYVDRRRRKAWWKRANLQREVWPFEGEYWVDELGYYVGQAEALCPE